MTRTGPPGFEIQHRFANDGDAGPISFDKQLRTVDAVISRGSPVKRFYGVEVLRIDPQSVIIDRLVGGGIPLLNSHNQGDITAALGKVTRVWFSDDGALMGKLKFNDTAEGRKAGGMVERGEIAGISAGYRVEEWEISDAEGRIVDEDQVGWDDDLTFTATRWELIEASLVSTPADNSASIRSLGGGNRVSDTRARMMARQRMSIRQAMSDRQSVMFGDHDD